MSNPGGFLAIDCGNTRLKATWMPDSEESSPEVRFFRAGEPEELMEWIENLKKSFEVSGALSVVGNLDARTIESLRRALRGNFLVLTPSVDLPIRLAYKTPSTLGLDRKATACGAAVRFPGESVLIADAGTALTLDYLSARSEFVGGNISPGLRLRFRSLHDCTSSLPLVEEPGDDLPEIGTDTLSAIRAGVVGGWIDEIAAAALRCAGKGAVRIMLTGGDAPLAARLLPGRIASLGGEAVDDIKIDHSPHLLAEGLRAIYRHHENEI